MSHTYLVITLVPLQFYGSYNIIRSSPTFTTFLSNNLRMAFDPKRYPVQDTK